MILAFDAATDRLTIALGAGGDIVAEINEEAPRAHLGRLLPAIDALMNEAGLDLSAIDHIAVGIGPGSFTGLRIAAATAQGLAHGLDRPLIGVSTLDAIAAALAPAAENIEMYPVIDAKRHEVFTAGYDRHSRRLTEYLALRPQALADQLAAGGKTILMAGDGLVKHSSVFADKLGPCVIFAEASLWPPRASVLIRLVEEKIDKGEVGTYFNVLPIYVRLPDAKEAVKREE